MPNRFLGREFGKYKVTRLLGGGAFSWVYEAIDQDLEIPVALKILRPEYSGDPAEEARFRKEAATAARLRHPNIVTVRDVGRVDDASFVAMDLFSLSLARRLELLPRLPETEVVRIGLDIAAALSVAHAGGIVHRDIKPDNILIGTQGEAVVADFGLAHALALDAPLSAPNQVTGTPHYFSPEQAQGRDLDGRSDLYSLGVLLFRASTGQLPFPGDDWSAVARSHVEAPIPSARELVEELSTEFETVISRLLAKSPQDRFSTAMQLADALAALPSAPLARTPSTGTHRTAETVSALPPVTVRSGLSAKRRQRRVIFTGGGAMLLVAAGWFAWQRPAIQDWWTTTFASNSRTTTAAVPDSNVTATSPLTPDSLQRATDSATADSLAQAATATPTVANARPAPMSRRAYVTLTAPDSAMLYVDNARVGQGSVVVERPAATTLTLRAVLADEPAACESAQRDSVVRIVPGKPLRVMLAVRPCVALRIVVTPIDATMQFQPLDGGAPVIIKAEKATTSVLLPEGRYELTISAPRCIRYSGDTVDATRGRTTPLTRTISLSCS